MAESKSAEEKIVREKMDSLAKSSKLLRDAVREICVLISEIDPQSHFLLRALSTQISPMALESTKAICLLNLAIVVTKEELESTGLEKISSMGATGYGEYLEEKADAELKKAVAERKKKVSQINYFFDVIVKLF